MTARAKFIAALNDGKTVNELAFSGWLADFSKADRAWLRGQVKAGSVRKIENTYPFNRAAYAAA